MDREKVINELNTDVLPFLQHHCDMQCDREKRWISKMIITVHDALALLKEQEKPNGKCVNECECWDSAYERGKQNTLKEQEAVKPVLDEQTGRIWLCGKCGTYVGFEDHDPHDPNEYDKFCRECGHPVLWEGR